MAVRVLDRAKHTVYKRGLRVREMRCDGRETVPNRRQPADRRPKFSSPGRTTGSAGGNDFREGTLLARRGRRGAIFHAVAAFDISPCHKSEGNLRI